MKKGTPQFALPLTLGVGAVGLTAMATLLSPQTVLAKFALSCAVGLIVVSEYFVYKMHEEYLALKNRATQDSLTGLLNREAFTATLKAILAKEKEMVALLFLDLNKFKVVNDTLGHAAGDELLVISGKKLNGALTKKCSLFRLGGDEFAIIITQANERDIEYVARSVSEAFYQPFELKTINPAGLVEVGVSIGISTFPVQASTDTDLIRYADLAMYEAKRTAQPYVYFTKGLAHLSEEELYLGSVLRTAINHNQMVLEYQPKLNLKTNKIVGAEALLRWEHPILGRVMPDRFIGVAEQQGLINSITEWVIARATTDIVEARKQGLNLESVAVNISPFSVINGNLLVTISKSLASTGVDPASLIVEVTETSIQHKSDALIKILICLEVLGIGISIDDFGTGQSSLLYLKYLPTTEIKIDKSFVLNILKSKQDYAIVRSLISLAHDLGCSVCAEGVETEEIRRALIELGCDTAQGYLISKPVALASMIKTFGD